MARARARAQRVQRVELSLSQFVRVGVPRRTFDSNVTTFD